MVARNADALEAVRREMPDPGKHRCVALDLTDGKNIEELACVVKGLGPLDIMVHNLGGSAGVFQPFASVADWAKVWHYNVGIGHDLNRIFIPSMIDRKWGRIVHLSTLSATTFKGNPAYVSAKCALTGYVKAIGREVAKHNVVVSAIAPGAVYTEGRYFAKLMKEDPAGLQDFLKNNHAAGRLGTADEFGPMVAFLCSDQAAYMSGSIVAADGGGM
jgi:3-oxoacyl-[acyl-carrier protein] reductase